MKKDELIGRAREMWDLFVAAMTCLYEAIVGKEISCPPCAKCTTLRWIMGAVLAFVVYQLIGAWFFLLVGVLLLYLVTFGEGMWVTVRETIAKARGKGDV